MLFLRLAFLVLVLSSPGSPDTPALEDSACASDEDWCKLEQHSKFPPCFSNKFIDSLHTARGVVPATARRTIPRMPFADGEKFVFDASWGPISAGYVILESAPDPSGKQLIITAKGLTNGFFSSMYKVRDYIRATVDINGIYPFFFEQHLREGRYRADRWEMFDQDRSIVFTHKKDADSVPAPPFVQNYFSMIYYIRTLSFAPGDSFSFDCFVDKKPYRLVLHCPKRSTVKVDAGTFNCVLVKPVLVGEGRVFTKKDEIVLWFTDDEYRMPVMARARIKFGSIMARLIWYKK